MKHLPFKLTLSAVLLAANTAQAKTVEMPDNEQLHPEAVLACKSAVTAVYPSANPKTTQCYVIDMTDYDSLFGFIAYRADHSDLSEGKVEIKKVETWHKAINLKSVD